MLRHIVLFKFRKNIQAQKIAAIFKSLEEEKVLIPGVLGLSWGKAIIHPETKDFTHGVIMDFSDKAAYEAHLNHPHHIALREKLLPLLDGDLENTVLRFDFIV